MNKSFEMPRGRRRRRAMSELTKDQMLKLAEKAGVLPHEMMDDPEHGLLISPAGVQKMRSLAPPSHASAQLGQQATRAARSAIRRVK
jgi:hypothetical protein